MIRKLLLAGSTAAALAYARFFGGPMDGTAWDIKLRSDSFFSFAHRDTLIFEKGKLTAAGYAGSGFSSAVYSAQSVEGDIDAIWNASLSHDQRGVMTWHGLVRGDSIEGMAVLWTRDGKSRRFTFKGHRKAA